MKFFIKSKPPFNFDLVASLYSRFPVQSVDLYNEGVYERVLDIGNKLCLVRVKSIGSTEKLRLLVEVLPDRINERDKELIKAKIKWIIGADEDIKEFKDSPILAAVLQPEIDVMVSGDKDFTENPKLKLLRHKKIFTTKEALRLI